MALFRSSLFNVRIGDADVPVGPSSFLKVLLDAADRGVDRGRAKSRVTEVMNAMTGVSFQKAQAGLPVFCFELMQNVPEQDQRVVADELNKLSAAAMDDEIKAVVLGLKLMNVVGADVLLKAVESLAPKIRAAAKSEMDPVLSMNLGTTSHLTARVLDKKGGDVATPVEWNTADRSIASVDQSGVVFAGGPGTTTISASAEGISARAVVEVTSTLIAPQLFAEPVEPPRV